MSAFEKPVVFFSWFVFIIIIIIFCTFQYAAAAILPNEVTF